MASKSPKTAIKNRKKTCSKAELSFIAKNNCYNRSKIIDPAADAFTNLKKCIMCAIEPTEKQLKIWLKESGLTKERSDIRRIHGKSEMLQQEIKLDLLFPNIEALSTTTKQ
jgi:hypothetical protein